MKIIALEAENLKKLRAVEIRPDGNVVQITGRNGQGKTSVLDAIWWAMTGGKNVQAEPIRRGAERAKIKLDLGEYVVTRTFKRKEDGDYSTALTVETEHGAKMTSPQNVLDAMIGSLTFDPLGFTRMAAKDQFQALTALVPNFDFAAMEKANNIDFATRTDVNRKVKDLRAQAEGIKLPAGTVPTMVDLSALEEEFAQAGQQSNEIATKRENRRAAEARIAAIGEEIARLGAERDTLQKRLDEAGPLPDPVDITALSDKLKTAREGNAVAVLAQRKADLNAQAQKAEEDAERLTKAMKERTAARDKAVAAAEMPVKGLGFGDGAVLLDGIPFEQASDAEQLRASIAIAGAMNQDLRVIRVRDGSLLDDDAMKLLGEYADMHDLQIWVERVDSSGMVGFVLEDGHLKGAPVAAEEPEETV